jgi:hypothetical protein
MWNVVWVLIIILSIDAVVFCDDVIGSLEVIGSLLTFCDSMRVVNVRF